jgi:hypothetical protein
MKRWAAWHWAAWHWAAWRRASACWSRRCRLGKGKCPTLKAAQRVATAEGAEPTDAKLIVARVEAGGRRIFCWAPAESSGSL